MGTDYTRDITTDAVLSDEISNSICWTRKMDESGLNVFELINTAQTFLRNNFDSISPTDSVIRGIMIFIRLLGHLSIWDYLLWKTTHRTEELFIRSTVTTEIEIDSEL